jgi:hypothetical protein
MKKETMKEKLVTANLLDQNENIISYIRCSMDVFIYVQTIRPGVLVLTDKKLIFIADSIPGNELIQVFEKNKINLKVEKGLMKKKLVLRYNNDIYNFKNILSDDLHTFTKLVEESK